MSINQNLINANMINNQSDKYDVSAIVSTYNSERFIRGCLENLVAQSISDCLEIIVIDSSSQENERSVVEEFQKRYENISYIRTEAREGLYAAWNRGVRLARGKYITNANTDDRLLPTSLELKATALDLFPDVGLVYADIWGTEVENDTFDPGNIDRLHLHRYPDFTPLIGLTGSNFSPQPMWRRSAHDIVGIFEESYTVAGDYEFFYRLAVKLGALHIREPLGLYLENRSGIEKSQPELTKKEFSRLRNKFYRSIPLEVFFPLLSDFPDDKLALGAVLWELGNNCMLATLKRESGLAAKYYEQTINLLGKVPVIMHNLAVAYIDLGQLDRGLSILKKVAQNFLKSRGLFQTLSRNGGNLDDTQMYINQPIHPVVESARMGRGIEAGMLLAVQTAGSQQKPTAAAQVSILILVSDPPRYLRQCIDSVKRNTPAPHEIILLADRSQRDTEDILEDTLRKNKNCRFIWYEKGVSVNSVIKTSAGDAIVIMHDDVMVSDCWFEDMHRSMNNDDRFGVVGPMTNTTVGIQKDCRADYGDLNRFDGFAEKFNETHRYRRTPARTLADFCIMFRRSLVAKIGLFDESFESPALMVEDFCIRSGLEGFKNIIASDVFIHHWDSHPSDQDAGVKDRKAFDEKWRGIDASSFIGQKLSIMNQVEIAEELSQKGKVDEAVKTLVDGIGHYPDDKLMNYSLAQILINAGRFKDANEVLETIPSDGGTEAGGNKVKAHAGDQDIQKLLLQGYILDGIDQHEAAGQFADRVLAQNGSCAQALNLKGILAYRGGNGHAAEDFFLKAIESDPGYGEPYTNLGVLKLANNQTDRAIDFLEKGFMLSPDVNDIAATFHSAATAAGVFERAERLFAEAAVLKPNNRNLRYLLVDLYIQQKKYDLAMQEIEAAMICFDIDDGLISAALEIRKKIGPMEIQTNSVKQPTLSLCMIVKNEGRHLARCLGSAKPVVDEIIIVDTGSTDRTRDIAKIFGAKVYDFNWTNDFSAARNDSLSRASGDWIFALDADEVISPGDYETLADAVKNGNSGPVAYSITTRNYVKPINVPGWVPNDGKYRDEEAGTGWYPSAKIRLFTNDPRLRFEGPVHELVEPSLKQIGIEPTPCPVPVHHYGKLVKTKITSKGEEYYLLGKKKIEESGGDLESLVEFATQAAELGRHDEAVEMWQRVTRLKNDMPVAYLNLSNAYMALGDYTAGLKASIKALNLNPELKEAALNYSTCALCAGEPKKAMLILEALLQHMPDHPVAMALLSGTYCIERQKEKAFEIMRRIKRMGFECESYLVDLAERLVSSKRIESAILLLEAAVESNNAGNTIFALLDSIRKH